MLNRLIRIIPLYYLMTFVTFFLMKFLPQLFVESKLQSLFLIKSLLFIPFDLTGNNAIFPIMRIGWTINYEIFFYLLFWLSLKISFKYRGIICTSIISILVILGQIFSFQYIPLKFYTDPILLEFVLGMASYYILKFIYAYFYQNLPHKFWAYLCMLLIVTLFSILILSYNSIDITRFHRVLFWGIPGMIIMLCFFVVGLFFTPHKAFTLIGNMSFSIYLIHYYPIQFIGRKIFDFSQCSIISILGAIISIIIILILSFISYLIIEKKLTLVLKKALL